MNTKKVKNEYVVKLKKHKKSRKRGFKEDKGRKTNNIWLLKGKLNVNITFYLSVH